MLEISGQRQRDPSPKTVPSTPVATDLTLKLREVKDQTSAALQVKENAEKEAAEAVEHAASVKDNVNSMERAVKSLFNSYQEILNTGHASASEMSEVLQGYFNLVSDSKSLLDGILVLIEQAKDDLKKAEEDKDTVHAEIVREQEEISRKKDDLDIYRKRVEKMYAEHMPGQKVIL